MNYFKSSLALVLTGTSLLAQSAPVVVHLSGGQHAVYLPQSQLPVVTGQGGPHAEAGVWLGLTLQSRKDGGERLEVAEVASGSPAERAGVLPGDKLVALAGRAVSTHEALLAVLQDGRPGGRMLLTVERSKKVQLGESDETKQQAILGVNPVNTGGADHSGGPLASGVSVGVAAGTAAAEAGLASGDRVCALDGRELKTFEELRGAIRAHQPGEQVELRLQKDLKVELAARPGNAEGGRAIAGMGSQAFGESQGSPQAAPEQAGGESLFAPQEQRGEFWLNPQQPGQPAPGAPTDRRSMRRGGRQPEAQGAIPSPQERAPGLATQNRGVSAELLEELRGLRAEVSALRREIEALRQKAR